MSRAKRGTPTSTSNFGSSRRENHDATAFYNRFSAPEISSDSSIKTNELVDTIYCGDARNMSSVETNSVALIVTSPPYFAGKQYEEALGEGGIPANYFDYLSLLRDVFEECKRVLEPGGRIAVNVANLGRRPYRSLAGDVTQILEALGLLMRGEVIWWKGRAAGGSCAWGTFQKPHNPVLRDVTERIVIAGKGRFDRALPAQERERHGIPSVATITRDEFLEATTDLWEIGPESATRVGHPAPFPAEIPQRLIELYTYKDDVVLDPFMGSGSTAIAAVRTHRHYIGYDTDENYVKNARERISTEVVSRRQRQPNALDDVLSNGRKAKEVALMLLQNAGFTNIRQDVKIHGLGLELGFVGADTSGQEWAFDLAGSFSVSDGGLRRIDTLWKSFGKAALWKSAMNNPFVILTTDAPAKATPGSSALKKMMSSGNIHDCIELLDPEALVRLKQFAQKIAP